jgi:hypothetical protein
MEENLHNDDFEKFLQDQVKHHRMFPTDKTWRNINNNLHKDYKWPALTIAAFTFVAAIIAVSVYFSPGPNIFAIKSPSVSSTESKASNNSPLTTSAYSKNRDIAINNQSQISGDIKNNPAPIYNDAEQLMASTTKTNTVSNAPVASIEERRKIITIEETTSSEDDSEKIIQLKTGSEVLVNENIPQSFTVEPETKILSTQNIVANEASNTAVNLTTKKIKKKSKFSYQVYITPSASYRTLKEDKNTVKLQPNNIGGPVGINYTSDVNQVVKHKPGSGMETGVLFGYNISDKLKLKTGVQINARQYLLEAFSTPTEIATIALVGSTGIDSFTSLSSYRISTGYQSTELTNRYYQFSIPIAADYQVAGNKAVQLNIAAGIQPTYMLTQNSYLISSDFKNYVESPGMTRKWNINANIESYLSITSGNYKWQVGPQLRYQMLPTSVRKYPIREYLIDYGMKIGVSKSFR